MLTWAACPVAPGSLTVTFTSSRAAPVSDATSRTQPSPTEQACSVTHVGATAPGEAPADGEPHDSPSRAKCPLYSTFTSTSEGTTSYPTTSNSSPNTTSPGTPSLPSGFPVVSWANVTPSRAIRMTTARAAPITP